MTDGAALPGRLSNLVPRLRAAGLLDGFVTCGQAFGGELEAVTIWTGLLAAAELVAAGRGDRGGRTREPRHRDHVGRERARRAATP